MFSWYPKRQSSLPRFQVGFFPLNKENTEVPVAVGLVENCGTRLVEQLGVGQKVGVNPTRQIPPLLLEQNNDND